MPEKKIRVLNAKLGLESHERGIMLVSAWMKEEGMEVIYIGGNKTVDDVIKTAIQEDVNVIGLSFLGDTYEYYISEISKEMKKNEMDDVMLIVGGTIPDQDYPMLKEMGVSEIFPPGSTKEQICNYVKENVRIIQSE
jgi:methylmalonyl-CoA mutase C-terminal domain/subunit